MINFICIIILTCVNNNNKKNKINIILLHKVEINRDRRHYIIRHEKNIHDAILQSTPHISCSTSTYVRTNERACKARLE
jgi:hypothetical protein